MVGQSHGGVENRVRQARQKEGGGGEQDRRGFTGGAFQSQDYAGENPRQGLRQNDAADGLPFRPAQADAHHAETLRHGAQGFFGGGNDDRQSHDGQGQASR